VAEPVIIGRATLYLGDVRELLDELPSFDAFVTDPPYGIGMDGGKVGRAEYEQKDWDSEAADVRFILERDCPAIIWGGNYFLLPPAQKWLVWDKRNDQTTFADCELAWTNLDGAVRQFRWMWSGPYQQEREQRWHPTQKPLKLMKWCIDFIPKSEVVCDPFMGSGTTGVAAVQMGKDFVGVERDEQFFAIACKRIEDAQRQGDFFVEAA
jgi:site-specific DNA-methyltransferase (adenine-specific)